MENFERQNSIIDSERLFLSRATEFDCISSGNLNTWGHRVSADLSVCCLRVFLSDRLPFRIAGPRALGNRLRRFGKMVRSLLSEANLLFGFIWLQKNPPAPGFCELGSQVWIGILSCDDYFVVASPSLKLTIYFIDQQKWEF